MLIKFRATEFSLFVIFLYFVYALIPTLRNINNFIYYMPYVLNSVALVMLVRNNNFFPHDAYVIWRFLLILGSFASLFFVTVSPIDTFQSCKLISLQTITLMQIILTTRICGIDKILKTFISAVIFVLVYMLIAIDYNIFLFTRLGAEVLNEEWNANTIGLMASFSFLLLMMLKEWSPNKNIFYTIIQFLFVFITLFSGSRKSFFVLFSGLIGFYFLSHQRESILKILKKIIVILIIVAAFLFVIFNISIFYNLIGIRIERLVDYILRGTLGDSSIYWRNTMIDFGMNLFRDKPIFGYGLNSFRYMFGMFYYDLTTYAHNNYVELLVDVGIVGATLYYSFFAYLLVLIRKSMTPIKKKLLVLLVLIIVIDYGMVSYSSFFNQFLILVIYCIAKENVITSRRKKQLIIDSNYAK